MGQTRRPRTKSLGQSRECPQIRHCNLHECITVCSKCCRGIDHIAWCTEAKRFVDIPRPLVRWPSEIIRLLGFRLQSERSPSCKAANFPFLIEVYAWTLLLPWTNRATKALGRMELSRRLHRRRARPLCGCEENFLVQERCLATYTHTRTYTHIHTHTYTHTYIHTYTRVLSRTQLYSRHKFNGTHAQRPVAQVL